jgi:hypothetical protein
MSINNTIHIIRFRVKKYVKPNFLRRRYLMTQTGKFLITESGKKIRL